jgi:hypothetical protein
MNEAWTISTANLISLLATCLVGVCMFVVKKLFDKVELLDAEAVRKRDLKELEERLEQNQREMHGENRATMGEIRGDIRELRNRLMDGAPNRGGR